MAALIAAGSQGCGDDRDCSPIVDVDVAGRSENPDGVPYPPDNWGAQPRQGSQPGSTIPNFTFRGYPRSDVDGGLQTISLADYYDPESKRHKVLHLMLAVMWCPHCQNQTAEMAQLAPALREEGAVFIEAIADGPEQGVAPTLCDIEDWIDTHHTDFTVVLDFDARRLSSVVAITATPYNALIDTRTMEVLSSDLGAPTDFAAYVRAALQWVDAN